MYIIVVLVWLQKGIFVLSHLEGNVTVHCVAEPLMKGQLAESYIPFPLNLQDWYNIVPWCKTTHSDFKKCQLFLRMHDYITHSNISKAPLRYVWFSGLHILLWLS